MRFSILTLLGLVAFAALCCMALLNASTVLAEIANTIEFMSIVFAVLLAVFGRSSSRPFWIGFAICGVAYTCPLFTLADRGVPTRLGIYLYDAISEPDESTESSTEDLFAEAMVFSSGFDNPAADFARTFYAIVAIIIAFLGGLAGQFLSRGAERQKQNAQAAEHA